MNKAAFFLDKCIFEKVSLDFSKKTAQEVNVSFKPKGIFNTKKSEFELIIVFSANSKGVEEEFVKIECSSVFKFEENTNFETIPSYFYRNSIAIIFPYIRAFVSTVTLQANVSPIILPTLNLSELEKPLKDNTTQI